jgi:hypothetical protein
MGGRKPMSGREIPPMTVACYHAEVAAVPAALKKRQRFTDKELRVLLPQRIGVHYPLLDTANVQVPKEPPPKGKKVN